MLIQTVSTTANNEAMRSVAPIGTDLKVRSVLSRDALSLTPVSTVSETARGMRAHPGPRIGASTPRQAGPERKGFPIPLEIFGNSRLLVGDCENVIARQLSVRDQ